MRRAVLLALVACEPATPEQFDRAFVSRWCALAESCPGPRLELERHCRRDAIAVQEGVTACLATRCTFDRAAAARCLDGLESPSCSAFQEGLWSEDCDRVWRDCAPDADACRGLGPEG